MCCFWSPLWRKSVVDICTMSEGILCHCDSSFWKDISFVFSSHHLFGGLQKIPTDDYILPQQFIKPSQFSTISEDFLSQLVYRGFFLPQHSWYENCFSPLSFFCFLNTKKTKRTYTMFLTGRQYQFINLWLLYLG